MKRKALVIIFVLITIISVFAQEDITLQEEIILQEDVTIQKDITFSFQSSPIYFLGNILNIYKSYGSYTISMEFEFQYAINNYFNISINPILVLEKYVYGWYFDGETVHRNETQFIIVQSLLFRPFKSRLKGMYIGAHFPAGFINQKDTGRDFDFGSGYRYRSRSKSENRYTKAVPEQDDYFFLLGIGASVGYQWILKNGFTTSLGFGGRYIWPIALKDNINDSYSSQQIYYWPLGIGLTFRMGYSF